ncbi:transposase [Bradyrhizobium sp.]|uniref:REP-associated tyrosine transposase n=1 Tax=Bradyrhizobium sp. TaxID=376 RepID=UPI000A89E030|nr:transposase [Bradyrhizobium sp.]
MTAHDIIGYAAISSGQNFTVVLAERPSDLLFTEIERFRRTYRTVQQRRPFETIAICVLLDHVHALWALPEGDADFSIRWNLIKSGFSRGLEPSMSRSASKVAKREKGVWQRRYWEHTIRNDADLERHIDYIHFNPVKHGHVTRAVDWPHSSFHRYVERGLLALDWGGDIEETQGAFWRMKGGHGAKSAFAHPTGFGLRCTHKTKSWGRHRR